MVWMEGKVFFLENPFFVFLGWRWHQCNMYEFVWRVILRLGVGTLSSPVETFLRWYSGTQSA